MADDLSLIAEPIDDTELYRQRVLAEEFDVDFASLAIELGYSIERARLEYKVLHEAE